MEGGATALGPDGEVSLKGSFLLEDVIINNNMQFVDLHNTFSTVVIFFSISPPAFR